VKEVTPLANGKLRVRRRETPSDARQRLMETPSEQLTKDDALSFHSSIPANPEHSRKALAYDVVIGQARSLDDEAFYAYLCRVADWRLGWTQKKADGDIRPTGGLNAEKDRSSFDDDGPSADLWAIYENEAPANQALIAATADYRANGKPDDYPQYFNPALPHLVKSETRG